MPVLPECKPRTHRALLTWTRRDGSHEVTGHKKESSWSRKGARFNALAVAQDHQSARLYPHSMARLSSVDDWCQVMPNLLVDQGWTMAQKTSEAALMHCPCPETCFQHA